MDEDKDEWTGLQHPCGCYESKPPKKTSGHKHEDIQPHLSPRTGRDGISYTLTRGDYKTRLVSQGLPRYWFRELAGDPQTIVWMEGDTIINTTSRENWEQMIKFRQEFLLERDQPDYHKALCLDVILGSTERPMRRCFKQGLKSYMMRYSTMPKYSRIDIDLSLEPNRDKDQRTENDLTLLRESDRQLMLMRKQFRDPRYDTYLELKVSGLGFMSCEHQTPEILG
ncbi:hypothetical protein KCU65_g8638, partial [Aureobasidium melanogenum]